MVVVIIIAAVVLLAAGVWKPQASWSKALAAAFAMLGILAGLAVPFIGGQRLGVQPGLGEIKLALVFMGILWIPAGSYIVGRFIRWAWRRE